MSEFRVDPNIAYDVIELPSQGIYYQNNKKTIRVAYLNASDENILQSQNLIQSNTMISELLKRKILDKDISVDDIVEEDIQAILIFLRNTAFGTDYTFQLKDPKTNEDFTTTIDLSEIKVKEFNLKADNNGEYTYYLKKSKVDITFKFLSNKQDKELKSLESTWNGIGAAPIVTKELEFLIKSVNGSRDALLIHNFVNNLPITDSKDFRKYVRDNKPGLDLTRKIQTPSGENIDININFGVSFFLPFFS